MKDQDAVTNGNILQDLATAVRDNPLPSALIGMGLVWLFTGAKLPGRAEIMGVGAKASEFGARLQDSASDMGRAAVSAASSAQDAMLNRNPAPSKRASFGDQFFATARSNVADLFESQPLALGALGVALGAGLAASLPITSAETDLLGEASASLQSATRGIASDQVERAKGVASGVATTVAQEVRVQRMTKEALEDKANAVAGAVKSVLDQATTKAKEKLL
jgi:hypothetical protein